MGWERAYGQTEKDLEKEKSICSDVWEEYKKTKTLLELYRKVRKQVEEYNDTPNKTPKVLHLALDIQETLDKIDKLEEELDE